MNLVLGELVFDISERDIEGCNIIDIDDFVEVLGLNKTQATPNQKMRDDIAIQVLNPQQARIMLESQYIH